MIAMTEQYCHQMLSKYSQWRQRSHIWQ